MSAVAIDVLAVAGALGLAFVGFALVLNTVSGRQFEGYELVPGTMGVVQVACHACCFRGDFFRGR